jgi:8-oxo-dGTP diphosphatase
VAANGSTASQPRPTIAAAIIADAGKVVLVERRVSEGQPSWQFPAGAVEEGEAVEVAAVREAREEIGLIIEAEVLGERVHVAAGRTMVDVACRVVEGNASITDEEELSEFAWSSLASLPTCVPHGLSEPVQRHLDSILANCPAIPVPDRRGRLATPRA